MSDNGEGPMDAYVGGGKVLVVASSGVGRLMLVDSTGSELRPKGGETRFAILYPLILVRCGRALLPSCVSLKQLT